MAQKAAKSLASRNTATLNRTHLITFILHTVFLLLHFLFNRPRSLKPYFALTLPALGIEFYLERLGRPRYHSQDGSLRSAGADLGARGLTEYMWDVLYWTWGCMGAVCVFGDGAWWLWIAVPLYSIWLVVTTVSGMRKSFAGLGGVDGPAAPMSKRQQKLEKRGGQHVQYR
ncbi:hypothetical protein VTN31DRAFT_345 [Thermomyces dupontii]|uniref:uncharacterized protein n=1 Tax=Talaromyces thermophilus TaxID=28565 RepID=UPI0037426F8C